MQFCKDIPPGNARTKDCLEEKRDELSTACKEEVDSMIERRVRDFRLDSRLRTACENEIFNMCAYFGVRRVAASGRDCKLLDGGAPPLSSFASIRCMHLQSAQHCYVCGCGATCVT